MRSQPIWIEPEISIDERVRIEEEAPRKQEALGDRSVEGAVLNDVGIIQNGLERCQEALSRLPPRR
ncbi:MAG: hypothetical protein M3498_01315 [Deinococcota bacterium]|nr:hypothetical protein [Deinococcota bacterium]